MNKELETLISDYVNLKVKNPSARQQAVQDIIDGYESMQAFTQNDNGEFEMLTGNTFEEVSDYLKNDSYVKKIINEANEKYKDIDR